jgi:putative transposase
MNLQMNLQMNLYPLLPTTHQNFMECENMTYCRKIRIYPTAKQKEYFETFFGASRYIYNKTIEWKKNNKDQKSLIFHKIRPHIIIANKDLDDNHKEAWLKNIPYDTRQLSLKNALSSIKSSIQLLKNKNIQYFNHKFKSKKDKKQTFYIDHRALKNLNLFPSLLKKDKKLKVKKKYKKYENYIPSSDSIILKDGKNYYLLFTKEKEKINITEKKNNIISLDPGIKKFQSFYDTNGYVGEFGNIELKKKLFKTEKKIDKLMSISTKQKKSRLRNKCYKLRTKAKNIISDFHWKLSSFLCKNYKVILLPIFKSKKMRKNLDNISNRVLNLYSHYKFKERMIYQSNKYNCQLIIVDESYTTKTCGCCGMINNFIGNSNIFWCSSCKIELERDYQAARNILIKNTK